MVKAHAAAARRIVNRWYVCACIHVYIRNARMHTYHPSVGVMDGVATTMHAVATLSRLPQVSGLFWKRAVFLEGSFAKET